MQYGDKVVTPFGTGFIQKLGVGEVMILLDGGGMVWLPRSSVKLT